MTSITPANQPFRVDKLQVNIAENRPELGQRAARAVADTIRELSRKQPFVNIIFASAPSQNEFLDALVREKDIDWQRVRAFHMDEYLGLARRCPAEFRAVPETATFR